MLRRKRQRYIKVVLPAREEGVYLSFLMSDIGTLCHRGASRKYATMRPETVRYRQGKASKPKYGPACVFLSIIDARHFLTAFLNERHREERGPVAQLWWCWITVSIWGSVWNKARMWAKGTQRKWLTDLPNGTVLAKSVTLLRRVGACEQ